MSLHNIVVEDPESYTYRGQKVLNLYEIQDCDPQIHTFSITYEKPGGIAGVALGHDTDLVRHAPFELKEGRWYLFYNREGEPTIARYYGMEKGLYITMNPKGERALVYKHVACVPGYLVTENMEVEY